MPKQIVFITGNPDKAREVQSYTKVPITHAKIEVPELQSPSLKQVVEYKAKEAFRLWKQQNREPAAILVEDTSLVFHAWGKLPGTFIRFFVDEVDNQGLIDMLEKFDNKNATASTAFALTEDGEKVTVFQGFAEGTITDKPRGDNGFGWDKIFIPNAGNGRTWAEMSASEKQKESMRAKALRAFEEFLKTY